MKNKKISRAFLRWTKQRELLIMTKQLQFNNALLSNNVKEMNIILDNHSSKTFNEQAIITASDRGLTRMVEFLLNHQKIEILGIHNNAIVLASKNGHLDVVQLLLNDKRINPSYNMNNAVRLASAHGHLDIVTTLLKNKYVDPSDYNNYALAFAFQNKHLKIVEVLWKDKRVKSSLHEDELMPEFYDELIKQDLKLKIESF
jgi:hypothetical protein